MESRRPYEHSLPGKAKVRKRNKRSSGINVPYPEPQMDWVTIRLAKRFCETDCHCKGYWTSECRFKLLPCQSCFAWVNREQIVELLIGQIKFTE